MSLTADRFEIRAAANRAGIPPGRMEIEKTGDTFDLRVSAFHASQAYAYKRTLHILFKSFDNVRVLPGFKRIEPA